MGELVEPILVKPPRLAELPPLEALSPARIASLENELAWLALPAGQTLFKAGEAAGGLYIVTSGLLGVIVNTVDQGQQLVAEIHAGETLGEMSLLSGEAHSATVVALRHAEFYLMPQPVFDRLVDEEPKFLRWLTRLLVQRLQRTSTRRAPDLHPAVALVPIDDGLPVEALASDIVGQLRAGGFKAHRFEPSAVAQPIEWFDEMETAHDLVLYQAEPVHAGTDNWGRFCLRQTDRVVLLARATTPLPDPLPVPPGTGNGHAPAKFDLAIIEEDGSPYGTVPAGADRFGAIFHIRPGVPEDTARLARHLAGRSVGLVLSGGAARGFAHIGAIRALREAGVPIDRIGGTSMGSIIAAGVALGWDDQELRDHMRAAFVTFNPLSDYTFPWVALCRGAMVDRLLREHFGEVPIESLWRPYFAVSTNLTRGGVHIHRRGMLWRALRASVAIPGVLPPLVDGEDVLVDGGVINNFPVDIMAEGGRGPIIGIDVGGARALLDGDVPRQRRGLVDLFRPSGAGPGIISVLSRVGTVSSTLQTSIAKAQVNLLIEPALEQIPLLDWQSFDRAVEAGYRAACAVLETADLPALRTGR
ncbi:MAG TPA: patatin-like phospholipase family protein [Aliidongia sp.]|nr:patatin-like phospholipase family protein [Aliidongia sp.]